ncbi:MAG: heavy-metal-associated domain-containing protein [Segetibacter sp.]
MKTFKKLFVIVAALFAFNNANAQSDKSERTIGISTQTIKVNGVCAMCKKRIENAALSAEGIKSALWNENTQKLAIKYSVFEKEAVDIVQKKIASVGHDNQSYKADNTAYNALPDCCHYRNN